MRRAFWVGVLAVVAGLGFGLWGGFALSLLAGTAWDIAFGKQPSNPFREEQESERLPAEPEPVTTSQVPAKPAAKAILARCAPTSRSKPAMQHLRESMATGAGR